MNRRELITGLISLVAAPAIVRVSSIMPVKVMVPLSEPLIAAASIGGSLNAEQATAYYARLKIFMDGLIADGMWDKLETVQMFAAPTEELATTNWKARWPISIDDL